MKHITGIIKRLVLIPFVMGMIVMSFIMLIIAGEKRADALAIWSIDVFKRATEE